jgi:hypothetical protein
MPEGGLKNRNKLQLCTILLKKFLVSDDNIFTNTNLSEKIGMEFIKFVELLRYLK